MILSTVWVLNEIERKFPSIKQSVYVAPHTAPGPWLLCEYKADLNQIEGTHHSLKIHICTRWIYCIYISLTVGPWGTRTNTWEELYGRDAAMDGFRSQSTEGELCLFGQKARVWLMKVGVSTEQVVRVGSKDQVQVLLKAFSGAWERSFNENSTPLVFSQRWNLTPGSMVGSQCWNECPPTDAFPGTCLTLHKLAAPYGAKKPAQRSEKEGWWLKRIFTKAVTHRGLVIWQLAPGEDSPVLTQLACRSKC